MSGKARKAVSGGRDSEEETAANDNAVAKMKERIGESERKEREPPPEPEEDTVIEVHDDDDDDDDDEGPARAADPQESDRRRRRRERQRQFREEQEREREESRRTIAELRENMARMEGRLQQAPAQPQTPQKDPAEEEWNGIMRDQQALVDEYSRLQQVTPEQQRQYAARVSEIEQRKAMYGAKRQMQQLGIRPPDPHEDTRRMLMAQYPDVFGSDQPRRFVIAKYQMLLAEGRQGGPETMAAAVRDTRERFRLGEHRNPPPTSSGNRSKYTGQSRGGGGGGGGSVSVTMTKDHKRMADEAYPHIRDPGKRYEKWAKGPGRRMVESKRA